MTPPTSKKRELDKLNNKARPNYMLPKIRHFKYKDTHQLKIKLKIICHAKNHQTKCGMAILLSDKVDFRAKNYPRQRRSLHNEKEDHSLKT